MIVISACAKHIYHGAAASQTGSFDPFGEMGSSFNLLESSMFIQTVMQS